ncbi:MAG TPA: hypothetical protein DCS84_00460, partial [Microbacterium sp.]|nr:hypothetical protein [Microbacterium sp.]
PRGFARRSVALLLEPPGVAADPSGRGATAAAAALWARRRGRAPRGTASAPLGVSRARCRARRSPRPGARRHPQRSSGRGHGGSVAGRAARGESAVPGVVPLVGRVAHPKPRTRHVGLRRCRRRSVRDRARDPSSGRRARRRQALPAGARISDRLQHAAALGLPAALLRGGENPRCRAVPGEPRNGQPRRRGHHVQRPAVHRRQHVHDRRCRADRRAHVRAHDRPPRPRSSGRVNGNGNAPTVTVVLPSYRRLHRLPPLIHEYRGQGADQIVVVLDGPHEGWRDELPLGDDALEIVQLTENVGLARARIAGLERARGDVVLAVDDDVIPGPGLVARHRRFHAEGGARVLQGYMPVSLPTRRGSDQAPTYLYARDYDAQVAGWRRGDSDTILGSLWGGNVSLPRSLYLAAESFKASERLEYNEDLDLGIRLARVGATAVFDDRAIAAHHHARGITAYMRECEVRGQAVADLERRWGERPGQLTPMVTIPRSYSRVLGAIQRRIADHDRGGALQAAVVGAYRMSGALHAWRLQDAATRLLRRALIMRGYRRALEAERTSRVDTAVMRPGT